MRIRFPFAIAFTLLLALSSSVGLLPHSALPSTPSQIQHYIPPQSDKALHFTLFFILTLTFYFILDTTRKRILHLTLVICTLCLGVGSEIVQGLLPNGRDWDPYDVLANVVGSLLAVGVAGWFHRRSAERRRIAKYSALATAEGEEDIELGVGSASYDLQSGLAPLENGIVSTRTDSLGPKKTVEEELDNWDENQVDEDGWSDDGDGAKDAKATPATSSRGSQEEPLTATAVGVSKVAVD